MNKDAYCQLCNESVLNLSLKENTCHTCHKCGSPLTFGQQSLFNYHNIGVMIIVTSITLSGIMYIRGNRLL